MRGSFRRLAALVTAGVALNGGGCSSFQGPSGGQQSPADARIRSTNLFATEASESTVTVLAVDGVRAGFRSTVFLSPGRHKLALATSAGHAGHWTSCTVLVLNVKQNGDYFVFSPKRPPGFWQGAEFFVRDQTTGQIVATAQGGTAFRINPPFPSRELEAAVQASGLP